jgi:hypothetical protein
VGKERHAAQFVHDLGQVRLHPGSVTRRKNDERCRHDPPFLLLAPVLTVAGQAASELAQAVAMGGKVSAR